MTNWRHEVRARAERAGVDLPQGTVDELALHLEDLHAAALAEGASDAEAHARVAAALEESTLTVLRRHAARDPRRLQARQANDAARAATGRSLHVFSALRMAVRQFRHHPSFALVVVLVLGLGTGAATAVFTVVDSVILRPLPYPQPDRLVALWDTNYEEGLTQDPISPVNFMDYRALPVFKDAAAWWRPGINLVDPGQDPVRVNTIEVSANLFTVLGVSPQLGAGFGEGDPIFVPGDRAAVISDRLWRTRYGADPSIVGRPIELNGAPNVVLGVMPPGFHYPDDIDIWQRLVWDMTQHSRSAHFMEGVARLADGVSFDQAVAASNTLALRLADENPGSNKAWATKLVPLLDDQLGYYRPALMVLFGAVGLLLVIGCLNVASLLLTRAISREREIAVRMAMGAAPRQLVTQLLAESFVLSAGGALVGIAAAAAAMPLIVALTPVEIPRLEQAAVDLRALGVGLVIVVGTTIFFGLVPALVLLRQQLVADLKSGERGSSRGARRLYSVLVAGEVALACALLVASALLVRTVGQMTATPTGVDADEVAITTLQLSNRAYPDWGEMAGVYSAILEQIRQQPGVQAAGAANFLPLDHGWRVPFWLRGEPRPTRLEDAVQAQYHSASEGWFEAMGAEMVEGRAFTEFDGAEATPVVVVNETFARRFLADGQRVGRFIGMQAGGIGPLGANLMRGERWQEEGRYFEVVGVVRDIRNVPLGQTVEPAIYYSTRQFPFRELFVAVRAADTGTAVAAVREALKTIAPSVPMATMQTWGDRFGARTAEPRLLMTVLLFFGGLAALLAAIGVYGLFSWSVALRTRELAIRLTLGARPFAVGSLVVRQSVVLVVLGLVVGIALVRLGQDALSRVLYEVSPGDMGSALVASLLLLTAALIASVPPALRAMRVDPVEGLRAE